MNTIEATIAFAKRENGNILAASTSSPYFCFEAPDEDAVKRKIEAALAFYLDAKKALREQDNKARPSAETRITVSRIRPYSRQKRELAIA